MYLTPALVVMTGNGYISQWNEWMQVVTGGNKCISCVTDWLHVVMIGNGYTSQWNEWMPMDASGNGW